MSATPNRLLTQARIIGLWAAGVFAFLAGGCKVGPNYETPASEVNAMWLEIDQDSITTTHEVEIRWWQTLNDPVLDELVEEAYAQNLTLRIAAVRLMQAVAQRGIAIGQLFPQAQTINANYARQRVSQNIPTPIEYASDWGVSFDATWEVDLWGKYRRLIESADAAVIASLASYDSVMVSLVSEVAVSYVNIRTLQERLQIAWENIDIQEQNVQLAQARFDAGATSELDVQQAIAAYEITRASAPALNALLEQELRRLNVLLGTPPEDLMQRLGLVGRIPEAPPVLAVGIPADLLRRRPDIRQAESVAAAQSAQIGVAKAELYPAFYISGSIGVESSQATNLFDAASWTGFVSPGISWPFLNYGRLTNNVRVQDAAFQATILQYQQTVLSAAAEVESSLSAFRGAREQSGHLAISAQAAARALELARIQYREGSSTFTRVLNSQANLRQAQETYAISRGQIVTSMIATYKALGGGWEIRQGQPILPDELREQMQERTNWGDMLDESPQQIEESSDGSESVLEQAVGALGQS